MTLLSVDLSDPRVRDFWAVTRHADVVTVSRDTDTFSSYARTMLLADMNEDVVHKQRSRSR